jgi:hypothetical protein
LIQLQHEYKKLVEDFNCDIQEFITVQDPPIPLSNILHLTPLTSLHSGTTHNSLWKTNIDTVSNTWMSTWMFEQLALRTPKTFHTTSEQDLNPRPCEVNDHPSVLAHEMMVIEPGEKPTHILTWKTTF